MIGVLHALEGEQPEAAQRKDSVCPPTLVGTEHGIAGTRESERGTRRILTNLPSGELPRAGAMLFSSKAFSPAFEEHCFLY